MYFNYLCNFHVFSPFRQQESCKLHCSDRALEEKQNPTINTLKRSLAQYSFRQLTDFDKYKALDMAAELKNVAVGSKDKKADYYSSVHATLMERINKPTEQFKSYLHALIGDRDYDKIVEAGQD